MAVSAVNARLNSCMGRPKFAATATVSGSAAAAISREDKRARSRINRARVCKKLSVMRFFKKKAVRANQWLKCPEDFILDTGSTA